MLLVASTLLIITNNEIYSKHNSDQAHSPWKLIFCNNNSSFPLHLFPPPSLYRTPFFKWLRWRTYHSWLDKQKIQVSPIIKDIYTIPTRRNMHRLYWFTLQVFQLWSFTIIIVLIVSDLLSFWSWLFMINLMIHPNNLCENLMWIINLNNQSDSQFELSSSKF